MTTCSTLLALLVMPITSFYTEPFIAEIDAALPGEGLAIPYRDIVATLAWCLCRLRAVYPAPLERWLGKVAEKPPDLPDLESYCFSSCHG